MHSYTTGRAAEATSYSPSYFSKQEANLAVRTRLDDPINEVRANHRTMQQRARRRPDERQITVTHAPRELDHLPRQCSFMTTSFI